MLWAHHFDLRHDYYIFFNIFFGGRAGKNIQPPTLILMPISAEDTAAGGIGMVMWEKGAAFCYIY